MWAASLELGSRCWAAREAFGGPPHASAFDVVEALLDESKHVVAGARPGVAQLEDLTDPNQLKAARRRIGPGNCWLVTLIRCAAGRGLLCGERGQPTLISPCMPAS